MQWKGVLVVCLVSIIPVLMVAQNITGSIAGTVTDPSGAVLAKATVSITNTDTNVVVRTVKTDDNGIFSAPLLPIGHYMVTVEASAFSRYSERNVELNVNEKLTINAQLHVAAAEGQEVFVE